MARPTAAKESEKLMTRFFEETVAGMMQDILKTRQPLRRAALLAEIDALDKVKGRFYHWLTSQVKAA